MARVGKRVFFNVPGFGRLSSMPGASFKPSHNKKETKKSDVGVEGFTSEPMEATCSFKIVMKPGLSVKKLNELEGVNVTVEFDTGQVHVMEDAWTVEAGDITDGEVPMSMAAIRSEEIA